MKRTETTRKPCEIGRNQCDALRRQKKAIRRTKDTETTSFMTHTTIATSYPRAHTRVYMRQRASAGALVRAGWHARDRIRNFPVLVAPVASMVLASVYAGQMASQSVV